MLTATLSDGLGGSGHLSYAVGMQKRQSRRAAAANDNQGAWREAAFCWIAGREMAA